MNDRPEYRAIQAFYDNRTAKRSGVRLMNHIDEGLAILDHLEAPDDAKAAFCLHPLFQADPELMTVGQNYMTSRHAGVDAMPVMLTMEYRQWANAFLSEKVTFGKNSQGYYRFIVSGRANTGPIPEVKQMLIADKVQNYKDFELHHKDTHARSAELDYYFKQWLAALGISVGHYQALCKVIA